MASWDLDAGTSHLVDYRLVQNTFVSMFWRRSILDETVEWLREHDYDVVQLDARSWRSTSDMLDDFADSLGFPAHFGRSLAALNDCLHDVASGGYGWRPGATGLAVVLCGFDAFAVLDRETAEHLLQILARQARSAMLIGNRLLWLLQSDDPRLTFNPVGAVPVMWNDAEWADSLRGM